MEVEKGQPASEAWKPISVIHLLPAVNKLRLLDVRLFTKTRPQLKKPVTNNIYFLRQHLLHKYAPQYIECSECYLKHIIILLVWTFMYKAFSHVLAGAQPCVASLLQQKRRWGLRVLRQTGSSSGRCVRRVAAWVRCHHNKLLRTQSSLAPAKHMSLHSPKTIEAEHRVVWKKIEDSKCIFRRNLLVDC